MQNVDIFQDPSFNKCEVNRHTGAIQIRLLLLLLL